MAVKERPPARSLKEAMAKNPEAYDFSDLIPKLPADPVATLETMLGQHEPVRGKFFARPLKAKQQKMLIRIMKEMESGAGDILEIAERQTSVLMQLFAVEEGERFRDPTGDEIDAEFSIQEQTALLQEHFGLGRTVEGEDGSPKP